MKLDPNKCPICNINLKIFLEDFGERANVDCPHCGKYSITRTALMIEIKWWIGQ